MNSKKNRRQPAYLIVLFVMMFSSFSFGQETDARPLLPNQTVEREMTGADTHRYKFDLKANEFFQIRVEQKGVDVALKLLDADGTQLAAIDSPNGKAGPETLSFVADKAGEFVLEISGFDKEAEKGIYTINRIASRTATAQDKRRVAVEKSFAEGMTARDAEGQRGISIRKLEEAYLGWQELQDKYMADLTDKQLISLKGLPLSLGQTFERKIEVDDVHSYSINLKKGEFLHIEATSRNLDIVMLLQTGNDGKTLIVSDLNAGEWAEVLSLEAAEAIELRLLIGSLDSKKIVGKYQITSYKKDTASATDRQRIEAENLLREANSLIKQDSIESLQKAIEKGKQSAVLWQKLGETYWEVYSYNLLGLTFANSKINDLKQALENYEKTIPLLQKINLRTSELMLLLKISAIYFRLEDEKKAKEILEQVISSANLDLDEGKKLVGQGDSKSLQSAQVKLEAARNFFSST